MGNINPETKIVVAGSKYQKHQHLFCDTADELSKKLNEEENKMLETVINSLSEMSVISSEESFADGFKLGVKIMMEVFDEENVQLKSL